MTNYNNLKPIENKKPVETVYELKDEYKIPSYEEFMKNYERDGKVSESYDLEADSYGDIREPKKFGPMFNFGHLFQVLQTLGQAQVLEHARNAPDVLTETGRFVAEHSNELSSIGRVVSEGIRDRVSSSSSTFTAAASSISNYKTLWDWWANGITGEERKVLLDLGFSDRGGTYSLRELKEAVSFCEWAEREWPYTFSEVDSYSDFLGFKRKFFAHFQAENLPGEGDDWVKLKGDQGWKNTKDNTIWKKDKFHGDHWDVSDRKGNKIREVDFYGRQIWPNGPKNKNKRR